MTTNGKIDLSLFIGLFAVGLALAAGIFVPIIVGKSAGHLWGGAAGLLGVGLWVCIGRRLALARTTWMIRAVGIAMATSVTIWEFVQLMR